MRLSLFRLMVLFFFFSLSTQVDAQTYQFDFKQERYKFFSTLAFWGGSHFYKSNRPSGIISEFGEIDTRGLLGIDRGAVFQDSPSADKWSDYTLLASFSAPIFLLAGDKVTNNETWSIAMMGLQGFFIENGINQFAKTLVGRPRPFLFREGVSILNTDISKNSTESFFSGHTSSSAYFSFFTAKVFADTHPNSKWKPVVWGSAIALPAMTGYLRYKAGKHFPTDVIVGYGVGAAFGILVPELYKNKNFNLKVGSDQIGLVYTF